MLSSYFLINCGQKGMLIMPELYSYRVRHDTGAAPNPFWGVLSLVICKPALRRRANIGDWIIGTGSANSPMGDISDRVVFIMKVTDKMEMYEYDMHTQPNLCEKIMLSLAKLSWQSL